MVVRPTGCRSAAPVVEVGITRRTTAEHKTGGGECKDTCGRNRKSLTKWREGIGTRETGHRRALTGEGDGCSGCSRVTGRERRIFARSLAKARRVAERMGTRMLFGTMDKQKRGGQ